MENRVAGVLAQARDLLAETSSAAQERETPFTRIHNCNSLPPQMGRIMYPWWERYLLRLPLNIGEVSCGFRFLNTVTLVATCILLVRWGALLCKPGSQRHRSSTTTCNSQFWDCNHSLHETLYATTGSIGLAGSLVSASRCCEGSKIFKKSALKPWSVSQL